jgi:hypothetical protein
MNILWQDSVGSFLDPSIIDAASSWASFPGGDGGALWSSAPDGGSFAAGDSLLWDDGSGTSSNSQAPLAAAGMGPAGGQPEFRTSRGSLDIAWADATDAGAGLLWQPNGSQTQEPFVAVPLAGSAQWTSSLSTPADILWSGSEPTTLPALLGAGQPTLNMLAGGNPQPLAGGPLSLSNAPQPLLGAPFGGGSPPTWTSPLSSLPASQLVWDSSSSNAVPLFGPGAAPSGGQLPLQFGAGATASGLFGAHT